MLFTTYFLMISFGISLPIFLVTKNAVLEAITITLGVTLYHFSMRLTVGSMVNLIMKNKANHKNAWFREKKFENKLYKFLRVRAWKKYLPTYDPDIFDANQKTIDELIGATCQAELVHEIIMAFSLLPIAFIPLLGGVWAIIISSVLSMLIDSAFVILQRYNRPRLVKAMERFEKIKKA